MQLPPNSMAGKAVGSSHCALSLHSFLNFKTFLSIFIFYGFFPSRHFAFVFHECFENKDFRCYLTLAQAVHGGTAAERDLKPTNKYKMVSTTDTYSSGWHSFHSLSLGRRKQTNYLTAVTMIRWTNHPTWEFWLWSKSRTVGPWLLKKLKVEA